MPLFARLGKKTCNGARNDVLMAHIMTVLFSRKHRSGAFKVHTLVKLAGRVILVRKIMR